MLLHLQWQAMAGTKTNDETLIMQVMKHNTDDWCHLCGERNSIVPKADVWYPKNAEHDKKNEGNYLRICLVCVHQIKMVLEEKIVETCS